MFEKKSFLFLFLGLCNLLLSQTGKISGKIIDATTGEVLPGATVMIEGTFKGASADFDGNFTLNNITTGTHTVVISYITYETKKIAGVKVNDNDITVINIALEQSSASTMSVVEVSAVMNKENTNTLLVLQKTVLTQATGFHLRQLKKHQIEIQVTLLKE